MSPSLVLIVLGNQKSLRSNNQYSQASCSQLLLYLSYIHLLSWTLQNNNKDLIGFLLCLESLALGKR